MATGYGLPFTTKTTKEVLIRNILEHEYPSAQALISTLQVTRRGSAPSTPVPAVPAPAAPLTTRRGRARLAPPPGPPPPGVPPIAEIRPPRSKKREGRPRGETANERRREIETRLDEENLINAQNLILNEEGYFYDPDTGNEYDFDTMTVRNRQRSNRWSDILGDVGQEVVGSDICRGYRRRGVAVGQFQPKAHQIRVKDRFVQILQTALPDKTPNPDEPRGLLLYHGLGAGKTCSYALAIDAYLAWAPENRRNIYIFTSGALRTNFIREYCGFCGTHVQDLLATFHFITYNRSDIKTHLETEIDITDGLVVIDEVHNVINGKVHDSDNLTAVYDTIAYSDCWVICGSGTPIAGSSLDLFYLIDLLNPGLISLDTYITSFHDVNGRLVPNDEEDFMSWIRPIIDYVPVMENLAEYPTATMVYQSIPINPGRLPDYIRVRERELEVHPPDERLRGTPAYRRDKTRYYLAISMLQTRQISNFQYPRIELPEGADVARVPCVRRRREPEPEEPVQPRHPGFEVEPEVEEEEETVSVASSDPERRAGDIATAKSLAIPDYTIYKRGWVQPELIPILPQYGEKWVHVLNDILTNRYKHVIYTEFKCYHGARLIGSLLELYNISYTFFTGDLDDAERNEVLAAFNSPNNLHGEQVQVMIITDAGAEGITLLEVRKFHIMEQYISLWILKQVAGRANRYRSHARLPQDERNLTIINYMIDVTPYDNIMWSSDYASLAAAIRKARSIEYIIRLVETLT